MRVYVVHPGANWATSDVYDGLVAGLRMHGVDVYEGRIDSILNWYDGALTATAAMGADYSKVNPADWNAQRMASAHITQHILQVWPDLVIVVSGHNYHTEDVRALRRIGIPVACILTESPYFIKLELVLAAIYGTVFTNERRCLAQFQDVATAHYLPHAYNSAVHTPDGERAPACDVFFVGSWFEERMRLLLPLSESGIDFVWKGHDLSKDARAVLPNADAAAYYSSARINLNIHRTTTSSGSGQHIKRGEAESLNPRAYEIAACGGFQLCDDSRAEWFELFADAAPTEAMYRPSHPGSLEESVRYFLTHPGRREEIARLQHEAIKPHTWQARAKQVLEVLA